MSVTIARRVDALASQLEQADALFADLLWYSFAQTDAEARLVARRAVSELPVSVTREVVSMLARSAAETSLILHPCWDAVVDAASAIVLGVVEPIHAAVLREPWVETMRVRSRLGRSGPVAERIAGRLLVEWRGSLDDLVETAVAMSV